jgi:hypothetical protein
MSNYTKTEGGSEVDILTDHIKISDVSSNYATKTYVDGLGVSTVNLSSNVVTGTLPIAKGGTGATSYVNALAALGGLSSVNLASNVTGILPITKGGTGATSEVNALAALGGLSSVNLASNVTGILPIANGGTGAVNVSGARINLKLPGIYGVKIQFSRSNAPYVNDIKIGGEIDNGYAILRYNNTAISSTSIILATYVYERVEQFDTNNSGSVSVTLNQQFDGSVWFYIRAYDNNHQLLYGDFPNRGYNQNAINMIIIN